MPNSRFEVFFSGQVQGVGFRYNAFQVSRSFDVVGTVQNLPDRRVKMVIEGDTNELERFIDEVCATTYGRVTDKEINRYPPLGNLTRFEIVR